MKNINPIRGYLLQILTCMIAIIAANSASASNKYLFSNTRTTVAGYTVFHNPVGRPIQIWRFGFLGNGNLSNFTYSIPGIPVTTIAKHNDNGNAIYFNNDVEIDPNTIVIVMHPIRMAPNTRIIVHKGATPARDKCSEGTLSV